jgi:ATP-dependent protease HslVU (ClpYQ) peptidase subunit
MHGTTILCVRKGSKVVMMGDGQVSQGSTVVKPNAKKVRATTAKVARWWPALSVAAHITIAQDT